MKVEKEGNIAMEYVVCYLFIILLFLTLQEDYNSWNFWKVPLPDIEIQSIHFVPTNEDGQLPEINLYNGE